MSDEQFVRKERKVHTDITLDRDVYEELKRRNIIISRLVNALLKEYLAHGSVEKAVSADTDAKMRTFEVTLQQLFRNKPFSREEFEQYAPHWANVLNMSVEDTIKLAQQICASWRQR